MIGQSVRDKILAAIVAALNGAAGKPCQAYRARVDALQQPELPAFIVYATEESVDRKSSNLVLRRLTVRIECHVAGAAPQDVALDPLLTYATQTLFADAGLDVLKVSIDEMKIQWDIVAAFEDQALAALDFEVQYLTRATDPTVQVVQ